MHVRKRKRQSSANWFLFVDGEGTTLVLLGTLRNDALLGNDICARLRPNSVRNRSRQDVESLVGFGSPKIRSVLTISLNEKLQSYLKNFDR